MPINVTLGTNDLEISDANGDLIDTIAYQSIDTIAYVNNPGTVVNSSTLGAAPTVTGDPQWSAVIWLRDGRKAVIMLGDVDNQAGWTNDQTGFDALVADIYAAFPAGGGGGSGTLTNFTFPNTTYTTGSVANPTTTPALTITAINSTRWRITQAAHGLAVGDVVRRDSGGYAKAQADSAANAEVAGIVVLVPDAGTFVLLMGGLLQSGMSGLTDGTTYFLSPTTAGAITATEPTAVGQVSKPVFIANSTVGGIFVNMRGMLITAPSALPFTEYRDYLSGFDGQPFPGCSYNSIGGFPAWAKIGTGIFEVTMTGLFNLTTYPQGWRSNNGAGPMCSSILSSGDVCRFEFYDNANAPADPSTFFISITKYGS